MNWWVHGAQGKADWLVNPAFRPHAISHAAQGKRPLSCSSPENGQWEKPRSSENARKTFFFAASFFFSLLPSPGKFVLCLICFHLFQFATLARQIQALRRRFYQIFYSSYRSPDRGFHRAPIRRFYN